MMQTLSPEDCRKQLFLFFLVILGFQWLLHLPSLFYIIQSNHYLIKNLYTHSQTLHLIQYTFHYMMTYTLYWFSISLLMIFPIYLVSYLRIFRKLIAPLAITVSFLGILFLFIDRHIYQHFQFHLSKNFLPILRAGDLLYFLHLSTKELLTIITLSLSMLVVLIISYHICKLKAYAIQLKFNLFEILGMLLMAIFLYLIYFNGQLIPGNRHILANQIDYYFGLKAFFKMTPLQQKIITATESRAFARLNSSQPILKKTIFQSDLKTKILQPNVLWILVDTLRYDYVNPQKMPHTFAFSQKSQFFHQHISSGNSTQPGFFGLFYGLPPSYFSSTVTHHTPPMLFDVLRALNYQFKVYWSGSIHCPPFIQNIFAQVPPENIQMTRLDDVTEEDKRSTASLIQFLKHHDDKTPFFNIILFNSVHGYCNTQKFAEGPYESCYRFNLNNHSDPAELKNRYLKATRYVDDKIDEILQHVDLKKTIVLITSDHGESFNDYRNNLWGHAHAFTPNLTHVPLIIHWPEAPPQDFQKLTTHYDISPTFIQYFSKLGDKALKPYLLGQSLYSNQITQKILMGSYVNTAMWDIQKAQITIFHPDGEVTMRDLKNNLLDTQKPNPKDLKQVLFLMSKFYQRN